MQTQTVRLCTIRPLLLERVDVPKDGLEIESGFSLDLAELSDGVVPPAFDERDVPMRQRIPLVLDQKKFLTTFRALGRLMRYAMRVADLSNSRRVKVPAESQRGHIDVRLNVISNGLDQLASDIPIRILVGRCGGKSRELRINP